MDDSAGAAVDALLHAAAGRRAYGTVAAILLLLNWNGPTPRTSRSLSTGGET
jgi:hypothetical protein